MEADELAPVLTGGLGTRETESPDALSPLMFQADDLERRIERGMQDVGARGDRIAAFPAGERIAPAGEIV
ncbi:MAG TPA: hypothetical protein VF158_17120 [Longimicrobiales bacterium]